MQPHRIADPPAATTVHGLGLCDALRVELQGKQIQWVVDELDALYEPMHEALQRARAEYDALPPAPEGTRSPRAIEAEQDISAREYELRVLQMMRARVPAVEHATPVVLVGPSELVSEVVGGATISVLHDLSELISTVHIADSETWDRIRNTAEAVTAWVQTFLDCQAVEWFTFDPEFNPYRPIR